MTEEYDQELGSLVRYGVSSELIGLLAAVAESRNAAGDARYSIRSQRTLQRQALCRNLNRALWRLTNLLAAVEATQPGGPAGSPTLQFFWCDENITPGRFQRAFETPCDTPGLATCWQDGELLIAYAGGGEFALGGPAINELAALLEFTWFVCPDLEHELRALGRAPSAASVNDLSKRLQSRVNAYLGEHTQPEQQQRKARALLQWLAEPGGGAGEPPGDALILRFWTAHAGTRTADFRLFNGVVDAFVTLALVLDEGRSARSLEDHPLRLGSDAGEVDLERLEAEFEAVEALLPSLPRLAEPPLADIRFLTGRDAASLAAIDAAGEQRRRLPLSLLRRATFGAQQVLIGQAIRRKRTAALPELIRCTTVQPYSAYLSELADLAVKLDVTRRCVLHILLELRHADGAVLLLESLPDAARQRLAGRLRDADGALRDPAAAVYGHLPALTLEIPELNAALRGAREAFQSVNRKGLASLPDPALADAYARGMSLLGELLQMLETFRVAAAGELTRLGGADQVFASDLAIFGTTFESLYGARP